MEAAIDGTDLYTSICGRFLFFLLSFPTLSYFYLILIVCRYMSCPFKDTDINHSSPKRLSLSHFPSSAKILMQISVPVWFWALRFLTNLHLGPITRWSFETLSPFVGLKWYRVTFYIWYNFGWTHYILGSAQINSYRSNFFERH